MRQTMLIAGHGKLANRLIADLASYSDAMALTVDAWEHRFRYDSLADIAVMHVGSGRQLPEIIDYCNANTVPLIQGTTGIEDDIDAVTFPLVIAPNLSLLAVKFLQMLKLCGPCFHGCTITLAESHQQGKTSIPGTAVEIAQSLGLPREAITSLREPQEQQDSWHIPTAYLDQHAVHRVCISEATATITFTVEVLGLDSYIQGVYRVLQVLDRLEHRRYHITELVAMGVL